MTKLDILKKEWLKRPDVKAEYDALAEEFSIAEDDLTQEKTARTLDRDKN